MAPSNLDAAMTMRFATSGCKPASLDAHGNTKRQQTQRITRTWTTTRCRTTRCRTTRCRTTRCRTQRRNRSRPVRPQPHPPHTRYLSSPAGATLPEKNAKIPAPASPQNEAHATSMQPWQCVLQHQVASPHLLTQMATQNDNNHAAVTLRSATRESTNSKNHAHMNNHSLQNTEEEPIAPGSTAAAPAAHEVPFIAGRSHFTRKNAKIPAPAFSQNEAHATSMQPLQCVLQHQVANPHLSTRMATQNDNNHAAITLRSATRTREPTNSKNHAHMNNHSLQNTEEEPIAPGSTAAAPAATHGTFHRRPEPLYRDTVSCPGFPPKWSPCNIHAAMTMRFATSGCKPASLDADGNTKRQQSCSRYTEICNQRANKFKESRTHEQPLVAEHRGGTDRARFDRSRTRRTRGTFHRRPEPLYPKKCKDSCPGFLPKRSPCNIHAAITMRFATSGCEPASLDAHGNTKRQQSCGHHNAFCKQRFSHHHSLSIVSHFSSWCDVNSHTTIHWI